MIINYKWLFSIIKICWSVCTFASFFIVLALDMTVHYSGFMFETIMKVT